MISRRTGRPIPLMWELAMLAQATFPVKTYA
jgi:hypothetical protein